jgi:NTP pyrophosphatase (non-canonical NTP hydrolase)
MDDTEVCSGNPLESLILAARKLAEERQWQPFHRPRSLVLALVAEAGELAAELQWVPDEEMADEIQGAEFRQRVAHEMADVLYCLLRLSDVLEIDIAREYLKKLDMISEKYPISSSLGSRFAPPDRTRSARIVPGRD